MAVDSVSAGVAVLNIDARWGPPCIMHISSLDQMSQADLASNDAVLKCPSAASTRQPEKPIMPRSNRHEPNGAREHIVINHVQSMPNNRATGPCPLYSLPIA